MIIVCYIESIIHVRTYLKSWLLTFNRKILGECYQKTTTPLFSMECYINYVTRLSFIQRIWEMLYDHLNKTVSKVRIKSFYSLTIPTMKLLCFYFICSGLVDADLIGFNRNQNHLNKHIVQRHKYHSTSIVPVNDVARMKKALRMLEHKRYKKAAAVLKVNPIFSILSR